MLRELVAKKKGATNKYVNPIFWPNIFHFRIKISLWTKTTTNMIIEVLKNSILKEGGQKNVIKFFL